MYIAIDKDYLAEKLGVPSHLVIDNITYDEVEGHFHFNLRRKIK
jgi:hypothetical protein